jgi:hypothetical protein
MAEARSANARAKVLSEEAIEALRKKESILMSRTRVVRDIEHAQNPRYRAVFDQGPWQIWTRNFPLSLLSSGNKPGVPHHGGWL